MRETWSEWQYGWLVIKTGEGWKPWLREECADLDKRGPANAVRLFFSSALPSSFSCPFSSARPPLRACSLACLHRADVMPSQDYIRLVPGLRSKQGAVWSQLPVDYDSWSVELKFFITGRYGGRTRPAAGYLLSRFAHDVCRCAHPPEAASARTAWPSGTFGRTTSSAASLAARTNGTDSVSSSTPTTTMPR